MGAPGADDAAGPLSEEEAPVANPVSTVMAAPSAKKLFPVDEYPRADRGCVKCDILNGGTDAQNTSLDIVLLSEDRPEVQVVTYRDVFNKVRIPTGNSIPLGTSKCTLPPLMMLNKRLMTGAPLMSPERQ